MIDLKKRKTMKFAMASGALATVGSGSLLAAGAVLKPDEKGFSPASPSSYGGIDRHLGIADLQIDIYSHDSNPHDKIVLTNLTQKELRVAHFKQGSVFWNGRYIDLNALRGNPAITLAAKSSVELPKSSLQLSVRRQYREIDDVSQYVLADEAVENLEKGLDKVTLGAYHFENQLYVYPIPVERDDTHSFA